MNKETKPNGDKFDYREYANLVQHELAQPATFEQVANKLEADRCCYGHAFRINVLQRREPLDFTDPSAQFEVESADQLVAIECEYCGIRREPTTAELLAYRLHQRDLLERATLSLR